MSKKISPIKPRPFVFLTASNARGGIRMRTDHARSPTLKDFVSLYYLHPPVQISNSRKVPEWGHITKENPDTRVNRDGRGGWKSIDFLSFKGEEYRGDDGCCHERYERDKLIEGP